MTSEVAGFDPAARAASIKSATAIRETIAADTELLMAHAAREGWGEQVGLPTLAGNVLVFHFSSGRRGIIHLPSDTDYGNKG